MFNMQNDEQSAVMKNVYISRKKIRSSVILERVSYYWFIRIEHAYIGVVGRKRKY